MRGIKASNATSIYGAYLLDVSNMYILQTKSALNIDAFWHRTGAFKCAFFATNIARHIHNHGTHLPSY